MVNGKRLRVACSTLATLYGNLPEPQWTKEGSYLHANRWLEEQRTGQAPSTFRQMQEAWAKQNDPALAEELAKLPPEVEDDGDVEINIRFAEENGIIVPEDLDPVLKQEFFGNRQIWHDRFARQEATDKETRLATCTATFLGQVTAKGMKPKTYKEIVAMMQQIQEWWGDGMDVKMIDEKRVADAHGRLQSAALSDVSRKKRWVIFRRFVRWLYIEARIEREPRNLASKLLAFSASPKAIKVRPIDEIRKALKGLPEKLRAWALLGLNCGMTNADIGALRKDMVADGYLTRRRVKTGDNENVPTVTYKLWNETALLMEKFRSEHASLWFVSEAGTPLVENHIVDGKVKEKDLIGLQWKRAEVSINLKEFRSISATLLESHDTYGRYVSYFLAHSPKSIKDKHYAAPSPEIFDTALTWLHDKVFG
jgi:integrase